MRGMRGGALATMVLAVAGCGSSKETPSNATMGDPAANKAVRVESVRAWLDPEAIRKYDDSAVVVVRNTSDKIARGVTVQLRFPKGYITKQDQAIVLAPRQRGVFLLPKFDAPPEEQGQPKAEIKVDGLAPAKHPSSPVSFSGVKASGCTATGAVANEFERSHPGRSGLLAGLKDGKIVTAGPIFFEEPGLLPGKKTKFEASLEPLCTKKTTVDEVVPFVSLTEQDLQNP